MRYTLTPAYGRDYKSKAAVLADLNAGRDFMGGIPGDRLLPLNLDYLVRAGAVEVNVRYSDLRRVAVVKIDGGRAV